jgi:hypothetical protein
VEVLLDLETTPEIDIPAKMEEVSQAARNLIEGKMGLRVADIKVRVKQASTGTAKKVAQPTPPLVPEEPALTELPAAEDIPAEESLPQPTADDTDPYKGF